LKYQQTDKNSNKESQKPLTHVPMLKRHKRFT